MGRSIMDQGEFRTVFDAGQYLKQLGGYLIYAGKGDPIEATESGIRFGSKTYRYPSYAELKTLIDSLNEQLRR